MTESLIEFTRGVPPPESFPIPDLIECSREALANFGPIILQYANSYGFPKLRQLIATQHHVHENNIILGQGSLQLLDHLVRLYSNQSLTVAVEEPTYDRTITILRRAGAKILPIPLKSNQLDLEQFKNKLTRGEKVDFFYSIPDYQNPTGSLLPLSTRQDLIRLAEQYDFIIIEDSPYRRLRFEGESFPSFFELLPERVIHMSSFSKLISPGLRVGFMVLPDKFVGRLAKVAEDTYINPSYFNQAVVFEFWNRGLLEKHLVWLIKLYKTRRDIMVKGLQEMLAEYLEWGSPSGGFFIGAQSVKEMNIDDLIKAGLKHGIKLSDGRGFFVNGGERFIRLPFCALNEEQILEGLRRLRSSIESL